MKPIQDMLGSDFSWSRPKLFSRIHELRVGDEVVGRLEWKKALSSQANAQAAGQEWIFSRTGVFRTAILISTPANEEPLASLKRSMSGAGTLRFIDGREFEWKSAGFWRTNWVWVTNEGVPLLQVNRKQVTIEPTAFELKELALLALLGFYLLKMSEEESAAAATAAVTG